MFKLIKFSHAETSHAEVSLREVFFSRCSLKAEIDGINYFFPVASPGTLKDRGKPEGFHLITVSGSYPFNLWTLGRSRSGLLFELSEAQVQEAKEWLYNKDPDILVI